MYDPPGDGIDWDCDGHDPDPPVVGACGATGAPTGVLGEAEMGATFETDYASGEWAAMWLGRDAVGGFDANGDGHLDVALGAPAAGVAIGSEVERYTGAVYILYGPRCGAHDPLAYDAVMRGTSPGTQYTITSMGSSFRSTWMYRASRSRRTRVMASASSGMS